MKLFSVDKKTVPALAGNDQQFEEVLKRLIDFGLKEFQVEFFVYHRKELLLFQVTLELFQHKVIELLLNDYLMEGYFLRLAIGHPWRVELPRELYYLRKFFKVIDLEVELYYNLILVRFSSFYSGFEIEDPHHHLDVEFSQFINLVDFGVFMLLITEH